MTIAVDRQSNSVIVTAPDPLAEEVEQLVQAIDQKGAQSIQVLNVRGLSPQFIKAKMAPLLSTSP